MGNGQWSIPSKNEKESEKKLQSDLLKAAARALGEKGVFVHDAGTTIAAVREAQIKRFVIRLAKNTIARWSYLPENAHGNRLYGEKIRPLARTRNEKVISSTNDPSEETSFEYNGRTIKVQCWRNVVTDEDKVFDKADPYDIWFFLTLCILTRSFWAAMLQRQPKQFSNYTLTDGLLSNCH